MRPSDHSTARLIDASANRAREGLRTLEDVARFTLDDEALCGVLKGIRHDLTGAIGSMPLSALQLLTSRDTPGDVGTSIETPGERERQGLADVASAAAKRTGEALRSLEEASKVVGANSGAFESMRYRLYDAERTLLLALSTKAPQWRLCVLITGSLCERHPWEEVARLAIEGGADCLQLREKDLPDAELRERARTLVSMARTSSGTRVDVIINDRPDIALLCAADGVHLGQGDLSPSDARRVLGEGAIVGMSTASMEDAKRAIRDGASYCGLGPMFESTTKPKPALSGIEYALAYMSDPETRETPHLAISGITPDNASQLAGAGVRGVAVSSFVCAAERPDEACRAIRAALER